MFSGRKETTRGTCLKTQCVLTRSGLLASIRGTSDARNKKSWPSLPTGRAQRELVCMGKQSGTYLAITLPQQMRPPNRTHQPIVMPGRVTQDRGKLLVWTLRVCKWEDSSQFANASKCEHTICSFSFFGLLFLFFFLLFTYEFERVCKKDRSKPIFEKSEDESMWANAYKREPSEWRLSLILIWISVISFAALPTGEFEDLLTAYGSTSLNKMPRYLGCTKLMTILV